MLDFKGVDWDTQWLFLYNWLTVPFAHWFCRRDCWWTNNQLLCLKHLLLLHSLVAYYVLLDYFLFLVGALGFEHLLPQVGSWWLFFRLPFG